MRGSLYHFNLYSLEWAKINPPPGKCQGEKESENKDFQCLTLLNSFAIFALWRTNRGSSW